MLSRMDENSDLFRFDDDYDDYYIILITIIPLNKILLNSHLSDGGAPRGAQGHGAPWGNPGGGPWGNPGALGFYMFL